MTSRRRMRLWPHLVHLLRSGCRSSRSTRTPGRRSRRQLSDRSKPAAAENFQAGSIETCRSRRNRRRSPLQCRTSFRRDDRHFRAMLAELWRALKPAACCSVVSARASAWTSSSSAATSSSSPTLEWFLVDEPMLLSLTKELNAVQVDPLKTQLCRTTAA